jgi:hypothetical protein
MLSQRSAERGNKVLRFGRIIAATQRGFGFRASVVAEKDLMFAILPTQPGCQRVIHTDLIHGRADSGRILLACGRIFRATTRPRWYGDFFRVATNAFPHDFTISQRPPRRGGRKDQQTVERTGLDESTAWKMKAGLVGFQCAGLLLAIIIMWLYPITR